MGKEKICIEYVFNKASKNSLWNHLTTPTGLADWFADDVSVNGNEFTFTWNKSEQKAMQIASSNLSYIRFKWEEDEDEESYFEFRLHVIEITGAIALEVIDFVDAGEKEDTINLWDSQIKVLKRSLGV